MMFFIKNVKIYTTIVDYNMNKICEIEFFANKRTKAEEYFRYILNKYWKTDNNENGNTLSFIFTFYNLNKQQHARYDYNLLEFFNNFNYDINNIVVYCEDGYGRGTAATIDNLIRIQLNANEGKHNKTPHVHISRPYKHDKVYRINLETFTQMKGDKEEWSREFNNKERDRIIRCLKDNSTELIDMYCRITKGEYIEKQYIVKYEGQEYTIK